MTEWQETAKQYLDMYQSCKTECDQLRQALEEVEWVDREVDAIYPEPATWKQCPWCEWWFDDGHAPDCQRQLALKGGE